MDLAFHAAQGLKGLIPAPTAYTIIIICGFQDGSLNAGAVFWRLLQGPAAIWQNCTLETVALFAPLGYNLLKLKAARQKIFLLRAHREGRMLRSSRGARKVCAALAQLQAGHGRDQYPADTPRKRETRPLLEGEVKWDSVQTRLYSNVSARFLMPAYVKYPYTAHSFRGHHTRKPAGHEREYAPGAAAAAMAEECRI